MHSVILDLLDSETTLYDNDIENIVNEILLLKLFMFQVFGAMILTCRI